MDRDMLLNSLPVGGDFDSSPPWKMKQIAEDFIAVILDALMAEGREPDAWESHDLSAALGFIMARMYRASLACAARSLAPEEERSPLTVIHAADSHAARNLRHALEVVRSIPARSV